MPRKMRHHSPGTTYYVTLRGEIDSLCVSETERSYFFDLLAQGVGRFGHQIHAFCLLPDRMHLAIRVADVPLSRIIHNLTFRYTQWVNQHRGRHGKLFRGRYGAELIPGQVGLVKAVREIHRLHGSEDAVNEPDAYGLSSHPYYLGEGVLPWLTTTIVLGQFSEHGEEARRAFDAFVRSEGGAQSEGRELAIALTHSLNEIISAVCLEYGMTEPELVAPGKQRHAVEARAMVALLARESSQSSLAEAASRLGRDPSSLGKAMARLVERTRLPCIAAERLARVRQLLQSQAGPSRVRTLRSVLMERGTLPYEESLALLGSVIDQVLDGEGERRPSVVAPEQIVLSDDGGVQVEYEGTESQRTQSYRSPEVCAGQQPSSRSLVWSLGALLQEMLSGQAPTAESGCHGSESEALHQKPLPPGIPERIRLLIYRMLEPDPELRIQSLDALRHELEAVSIPTVLPRTLPEERRLAEAPGMELPAGETLLGDSTAVPFVGREREVSALIGLLATPQVRLITLVGPGGIGKSRLALETAQRVTDRFPDGVYVVSLSEVRLPVFIHLAIANALGLSFSAGDRLDVQVRRYLREKAALLVLDDLDRLVDGAEHIGDLVRGTALMKIVGTCRERLRLRVERTFDVGGLEVPGETEARPLLTIDSVRLFQESARRVYPAYVLTAGEEPVVAQICRMLEGIPLAIELAAGWVRVLPVREILGEVLGGMKDLTSSDRDVAPRHRSMTATFERSWKMLSERERHVLLRLSVFRGGFDRDAAQAVGGATLPVLASLVDKSLIGRDVFGRFRMHALLRQYVRARLAQDAVAHHAASEAHSRYYGSFLEGRGPLLRTRNLASVDEQIARERANIDVGFEWSLQHDDLDRVNAYTEPLSRHFQHRSQFQEGEQLFARGLRVLAERFPGPPSLLALEERMTLAHIKTWLALNKGRLGYYTEARNLLVDSLAIFEHFGTARDTASCLRIMANLAGAQGHYHEALCLFDRTLSVLQESGETEMQGIILSQMGGVVLTLGEIEKAQNLRERALAMLEKGGDPISLAQTLNGLGDIALHRGNSRQAQEYYERALSIIQETGHEGVLCVTIDRLAIAARSRGDYQEAKRLNEEVLRRHRETGSLSGIARGLHVLGNCLVYLEELGRSRELLEESVDLYHSIGERSGEASALCSLGYTCCEMRDWESAKTAYERSLSLLRELASPEMMVLSLAGLARCHAARGSLDASRAALKEALATYGRFSVASRLSTILLSTSGLLEIQGRLRDALIIHSFLARDETAEENHRECAREEIERLSPLLEPADLHAAMNEAERMDSSRCIEFVTQLLA